MSRRGIELPEETWRLLKAHAAKRGQTLGQLFADMTADTVGGRASGKIAYDPAMEAHEAVQTAGVNSFAELEDEVARLKRELAARPKIATPVEHRVLPPTRPDPTRLEEKPMFRPAPKPASRKR